MNRLIKELKFLNIVGQHAVQQWIIIIQIILMNSLLAFIWNFVVAGEHWSKTLFEKLDITHNELLKSYK